MYVPSAAAEAFVTLEGSGIRETKGRVSTSRITTARGSLQEAVRRTATTSQSARAVGGGGPAASLRLVALPLATLLALALAAAAHAAVVPARVGATTKQTVGVGIADQKPDMFADPRFASLGITRARLAIGWDALTSRWQVAKLDAWLDGAREAGVQPLISFMHSRTNRRSVPTPERLKWEFRRFRQLYPWVTTFATWNEANHCGEPLCHRPKLAAAYYRALRKECPSCTILAPELLDMPNMRSWVSGFIRELRFQQNTPAVALNKEVRG
jgi:hypothetical protein